MAEEVEASRAIVWSALKVEKGISAMSCHGWCPSLESGCRPSYTYRSCSFIVRRGVPDALRESREHYERRACRFRDVSSFSPPGDSDEGSNPADP